MAKPQAKPGASPPPTSASQLVGEQLKRLRRLRGWSARRLAERCAEAGAAHLTPYVIANIETNRRQVPIDDLLGLAYACDVSPTYFLSLTEDASALAVTDTVRLTNDRNLRQWIYGQEPLPGMDQDFFRSHDADAKAGVSDVEYGRSLLLSASKRLIAQYDARADEFLSSTRRQVREVIGDLRQAVAREVGTDELLHFLDDVESELAAERTSRSEA